MVGSLNNIAGKDSTKGDWSSGMIPVLGTGGPGFNSRIAPFLLQTNLKYNMDNLKYNMDKL